MPLCGGVRIYCWVRKSKEEEEPQAYIWVLEEAQIFK